MPKWLRGEVWHGYVRVNGIETKPRSTGCRDEAAADAVLAEWEREIADPAYAAAKKGTVDQAADGLLKHYQGLVTVGKKASSTEDYYSDKLGTVARVLGPKLPLSKLNAGVIDKYIETRRAEQVTEHTIGKELDALKVMLKWAKRAGTWAGDIDALIPSFGKMYAPRDRVLDEDEIFALLGVLSVDLRAKSSHRSDIAAQAAFAIATSAEAKCLLNAQRTDVAGDQRFVLLRGTKRETRWRTVPIVMPWQKALLRFAIEHAHGQGVYLFGRTPWGLRNAMRKACLALDIPHVSPNDLRRTFAVGMREAGFPLELIAPLMGHKDTRMLERVYGRLGPDKIRSLLIRLMELNASAVCEEGVVNGFGFGGTYEDDKPKLPSKLAPRPGLEPGTHGLTVPSKPNEV